MKVTTLSHKRRSWASNEPWVWSMRVAHFLSDHDGQMFTRGTGYEIIIYADTHPDEQTLDSWFTDGAYGWNEVTVRMFDDAPADMSMQAIFGWLDEQYGKARTEGRRSLQAR